MTKKLINIGFGKDNLESVKFAILGEKKKPKEFRDKISTSFSDSGNSSFSEKDELKRLEQEFKERKELIKKKQEEDKKKLEEEKKKLKKVKKQKFKPYSNPVSITDNLENVELSFFDKFNFKFCPSCSSKLQKYPTKQQGDILRQFFRCKNCSFEKEIIFKI